MMIARGWGGGNRKRLVKEFRLSVARRTSSGWGSGLVCNTVSILQQIILSCIAGIS